MVGEKKKKKAWEYLVWEIEKNEEEKKKEDSVLKDTVKYPNICINTVLEEKIETKWNKDYLSK